MELEYTSLFWEETFLDESVSDVEVEINRLNTDQRRVDDRVVREHIL